MSSTRRTVLYTVGGTAVGLSLSVGVASADHSHADVQTEPATNVETVSATLNGDPFDMGGVDSVDVWFEWGREGDRAPERDDPPELHLPG